MGNIPLILFAKVPILGEVKTRLQPQCNPEESVQVARILIEQTIEKVSKSWDGPIVLAIWPDQDDDFITELTSRFKIHLIPQAEGDLGQKMLTSLNQLGYPAVVMGCDVPHCTNKLLQETAHHLYFRRNVIGPSADGGYYLMGLQSSVPELFSDIEWGSSSVYEQTMVSAKRNNIQFSELPTLVDIDKWADLVEVSSEVPALACFLRDKS